MALNEDSVEKKLKTVQNTQDSIQTLSLWIIHHKTHHSKIVELWLRVLKRTVHLSHRLTLFYLCNDVVQTCKKKKAPIYNSTFKEHLPEAACLVRDISIKPKVERIFTIWKERNVFDKNFIQKLFAKLNGQQIKSLEASNDPLSPEGSPYTPTAKEQLAEPEVPDVEEEPEELDAEESARILAVFKPHEMIEQITSFRRQEAEIQLKVSQLNHLKLDASNLHAIRQLKDRTRGNDFSNQFEDSCTRQEELVKRQSQHLENQKELLKTMTTSETFYEEQYREAKIVANAYKNFGARINNMKKKLDELKKSLPKEESPVPSPDINAPSPENSPIAPTNEFNPTVSQMASFQSAANERNWLFNGSDLSAPSTSLSFGLNIQDSPPLEAPSPDGSPPDLNLEGSISASASLDSRLATFLDRRENRAGNTSTYVHQAPKFSKAEDDDPTTPLDDETPTTPVQDEHLASPPKTWKTPPKKENPIDFLSRLITQGNNSQPKTSTASFLDSLTNLTGLTSKTSMPELTVPTSSQPPSPSLLYPSESTPTMVPPPPIPLPVPPPGMTQLSPPPLPPNLNLSVPPPPPPPFGLQFTIPPPGFQQTPPPPIQPSASNLQTSPGIQQTSPGQKENWPQVSNDSSLAGRISHSSVLKELTPAKEPQSNPEENSLSKLGLDSNTVELVSDEDDDKLGLDADNIETAKDEFVEKLKQKTSGSSSGLKSHVSHPISTRLSTEDKDNENNGDEASSWLSRSQKSRRNSSHSRSHSRSNSREKDRSSHKHKKKKKHKRSHNSDDERSNKDRDEDSRKKSKRIDPRNSNRHSRDSRDSRETDRKHDDSFGKHENNDDKKLRKDPVAAYTQAYRDAFFQQYNQGRFVNFSGENNRSSYSKY